METSNRKSELYRFIQTSIFLFLAFSNFKKSWAIENHNYLSHGGQFHILADMTYSTDEVAKLRVEYTHVDPSIGGIDMAIYKVKDPLSFLKSQKDLHNVSTQYNYSPSGVVANSLRYVWDVFYSQSRIVWQRLTDEKVRKNIVAQDPLFNQQKAPTTSYKQYAQFKPIHGFELLDSFRYPITVAKKITPPVDKLSGSSNFFQSMGSQRNVYVPFGKLAAGVYLVEAKLGSHRANSLLFVSDTVVVSKISSENIFAWSSDKKEGRAVADTNLLISDGVGVLKQAKTNDLGFADMSLKVPEQSYLIAMDPKGGVSISENFYYESEIYNSKIYAFTDRPLYQPGDTVHLKVIGREFSGSNKSSPLSDSSFDVLVIDSSSTLLFKDKLGFDSKSGGDFSFKLPKNALPGGHSVLLKNKQKSYAAEFRVAKYAKPYFNLEIVTTPQRLELGKEAKSRVVLSYFNGEPVSNASVELTIRRQKLNVIEGDTDAESLFPINVNQFVSKTNDKGVAEFTLPPVDEASRYVIFAKATDSSQFTVSTQVEVSHLEGKPAYIVSSNIPFSNPGDAVTFNLEDTGQEYSSLNKKIVSWTALRVEDQVVVHGKVDGQRTGIKFTKSGMYRINFLNEKGISLGRINHVVIGTQLKLAPGSIDISTDKIEYAPKDNASFLVTTDEEVSELLITLEREKVEAHSLASKNEKWVKSEKLSKLQWKINFKISDEHAPNMVLSVLYVKNGVMSFSNKGFKVLKPKIAMSFDFDKDSYRPRDKIKLKIKSTFLGKPIKAKIVLSVVDEMIYVLQPEIAPSIEDFFYHVRRNQVKTTSTLSFFGYDSSVSVNPGASGQGHEYEERPMKLRERPRREDVDTAFFQTINTDSNGTGVVEFTLPDSMTKWRFTARAFSENGVVGQNEEKILVTQEVYTKWGSISDFRRGDKQNSALIVFNTLSNDVDAEYSITGAGEKISGTSKLSPGVNFVSYEFSPRNSDLVNIKIKGKYADNLEEQINVYPELWKSLFSEKIDLVKGENVLTVPLDSRDHKIKDASSDFLNYLNMTEQLISYPHGCVEQTSSKLIALALAYKIISSTQDEKKLAELRKLIVLGREHLVSMSNQGARYGWYESMETDSFITLYAYLADMFASQATGMEFDKESVSKVATSYRGAANNNVLKESLMLWMGAQMRQPVQGLLLPMLKEIDVKKKLIKSNSETANSFDYIMSATHQLKHYHLATLLLGLASQRTLENKFTFAKGEFEAINKTATETANLALNGDSLLSIVSAVYLKKGELPLKSIVDGGEYNHSTIDRALLLILVSQAIEGNSKKTTTDIVGSDWKKITVNSLGESWAYHGKVSEKIKVVAKENASVMLDYSSYTPGVHHPSVSIDSEYFEFIEGETLKAKKVVESTKFKAAQIYLLKVNLNTNENKSYGLLEVALPPGGQIERGLAGVEVNLEGKSFICVKSFEEKLLSIDIPIKSLSKAQEVLIPIRFGVKGVYKLPRTRFFQMYKEDKKSYEGSNKPSVTNVEIF